MGKLRSNFVGTEFQVYDDGCNPNADAEGHHSKSSQGLNVRKELAAVMYAPNVLGSRGPRKMQVVIPVVDNSNEVLTLYTSNRYIS